MTRLLRSEVCKASTTKLWWGMLLGAMAFSAIGVVAQIATNGVRGNPMPPLSDGATQRTMSPLVRHWRRSSRKLREALHDPVLEGVGLAERGAVRLCTRQHLIRRRARFEASVKVDHG